MTAEQGQSEKKPWYKRWWVIVIAIFFGIGIIGSIASPPKDKQSANTPPPPPPPAAQQAAAPPPPPAEATPRPTPAPAACGTKASDECTPHVAADGHVRVDALTWRVRSARVTKTLGDQQYGLGAKASGRFIVLKIHVHSNKNESATLTDSVIHLEVNGNTYDADNDGTIAAMGAGGAEPFFLDTIGPDSDRDGTVVFDVPAKVLARKIEVRFNELGFGETHGYIRMPSLSAG